MNNQNQKSFWSEHLLEVGSNGHQSDRDIFVSRESQTQFQFISNRECVSLYYWKSQIVILSVLKRARDSYSSNSQGPTIRWKQERLHTHRGFSHAFFLILACEDSDFYLSKACS